MPRQLVKPRKPQFKMGIYPVWFHHHGTKPKVKEEQAERLNLASNAAELSISFDRPRNGWLVWYHLKHSQLSESTGTVWMNTLEFKEAFTMIKPCRTTYGQHLIDRFGGDDAEQGKFIRSGNCLNIPGPGTGHDGDANISICVDEDIKDAIQRLLAKVNQ